MSELETTYREFIHKSRYARWLENEGRREEWPETVDRYLAFFDNKLDIPKDTRDELRDAILNCEVLPSMRAMMAAGPALDRCNMAGYNCSAVVVDHPRVFDEILYILMCGTGLGFSCERQFINKLPAVADTFKDGGSIIVGDSKEGWAGAYRKVISSLYNGEIPTWDVSKVRPKGARLKTFGGRSSGSKPLVDLFQFTTEVFKNAAGRKLQSIEVHDIICKIADVVIVGGVRRSALISLSNLTDGRMSRAKSGQWWEDNPQRALANNSVAYTEKPDMESFLKEWENLYESKSGERGMFSRVAANKQMAKNGRRQERDDTICNPCSEILLRGNGGLCNLTEVVVRASDTEKDLLRKIRVATVLGTMQATLTDFKYVRAIWKKNADEEALLGVSMTGIMDNPLTYDNKNGKLEWLLTRLKDEAISTNRKWAKKFDINQAAAITCVKPSGTVSQLVDSASGIHGRFSPYYIRTVRADKTDPLAKLMQANGFPWEEDVMKPETGLVFSFPTKSPEGSLCVDKLSAMEQLELGKVYQDFYTEHKVSQTVYYSDDEFLEIGAWLYKNFDDVSGVSFLPRQDHTYAQAPYQAITKKEYEDACKVMPKSIDWSELGEYEKEDQTVAMQTLSCVAGNCEI